MDKLLEFIDDEQNDTNVSHSLVSMIREFVKAKFRRTLGSLCMRHYLDIWSGWVADNCFTEGTNAAIVRCPNGAKLNDSVYVSCSKFIQHSTTINVRRSTEAHKMASQKLRPHEADETVSDETLAKQELSKHVITTIVEEAFHEWTLSRTYECCIEDASWNYFHTNGGEFTVIVKPTNDVPQCNVS